MRKFILSLSLKTELLLVLILGFGWFIVSSNLNLLYHLFNDSHNWIYGLSSSHFIYTSAYEVISFSIIVFILFKRNYRFSDFDFEFSFKLLGVAIILFLIVKYTYGSIFLILKHFIKTDTLNYLKFKYSAGTVSVISVLVINSFYEEFLLNGYLFKILANYKSKFIILLSVGLRMSYHTYQGWIGLVSVLVIGIVFSLYYFKYAKLWPIIIAHGLINLSSFYVYAHMNN